MPPRGWGGGGGGEGELPYIGYTGISRWKGYGFQAIWSGIYGLVFIEKWFSIGSRSTASLTNQEQLSIFSLV